MFKNYKFLDIKQFYFLLFFGVTSFGQQLNFSSTNTYIDFNNDGIVNSGDIIRYNFTISNPYQIPYYNVYIFINNNSTLNNPTLYGNNITLLGSGQVDNSYYAIDVLNQTDINNGTVSNRFGYFSNTFNPPQVNGTVSNNITIINNLSNLFNESYLFEKLIIYPNPVVDFITIENANINSIEIFDLLGKQLLKQNLISNQINVSNLQKGIYLLRINLEGKFETKKFIKE